MEETATQTREEEALAEMRMVADKRGYLVLTCAQGFFFAGKTFQGRDHGKRLPIMFRAIEKTTFADYQEQERMVGEFFIKPDPNTEYWRCEAID